MDFVSTDSVVSPTDLMLMGVLYDSFLVLWLSKSLGNLIITRMEIEAYPLLMVAFVYLFTK